MSKYGIKAKTTARVPEKPAVDDLTAVIEKSLRAAKAGQPTKISGALAAQISQRAQELGFSGGATAVHNALIAAAKEAGGELIETAVVSNDEITIRPSSKGGVYLTFEFEIEGLPPQNALVPRGIEEVVKEMPVEILIKEGTAGWNYTATF